MKKILTLLSFITVLSSSFVLVSCKISNTNQSINNKIDETKKEEEKSPSTKEKTNSDEQELPKDEPDSKSFDTIEEKKEKTDIFARGLKKELEDLLNKKEKESIMGFASKIISTYLQKSNQNKLFKDLSDLENEISKLFEDSNYDEIKTKLTVLFSEGYNSENDSSGKESKKIKDLLDKVEKKNKNSILEEMKDLFEKKVSKESEEESKNKTTKINNLLSKEQYDSVKNELFGLIDIITNLEKATIK
ncbi:lipoprotein [Mycoplasma feriruminatoris]|uniref:Lipoprotein n=1 Tax=Mycoplasma feriruminatoris TaxID=1179777 RepID=A0ABY8HVB1_9MOLU|nr:lipoprotein [Mycoplasma feriruminatoris]WFQ93559.1 lipoprotein [Mycoplasma feriruminatoris]